MQKLVCNLIFMFVKKRAEITKVTFPSPATVLMPRLTAPCTADGTLGVLEIEKRSINVLNSQEQNSQEIINFAL